MVDKRGPVGAALVQPARVSHMAFQTGLLPEIANKLGVRGAGAAVAKDRRLVFLSGCHVEDADLDHLAPATEERVSGHVACSDSPRMEMGIRIDPVQGAQVPKEGCGGVDEPQAVWCQASEGIGVGSDVHERLVDPVLAGTASRRSDHGCFRKDILHTFGDKSSKEGHRVNAEDVSESGAAYLVTRPST